MRALTLLAALLLVTAWRPAGGDYSLNLDSSWSPRADASNLVDGELARWIHAPTGGGLLLRPLDQDALFDVGGRAKRLDLQGALSPDRVARIAQQSQDEAQSGMTVYVGPGERTDLGRWVYLPPQGPGEPLRIWWQFFWRSASGYQQAIGWAPLDRGSDFVRAMKGAERAVSVDAGYTPPRTVLFDSGQDDCGPPVRADRQAALRSSERLNEAKLTLKARYEARLAAGTGPMDPSLGLTLAELRSLGLLYRMSEDCVLRLARERRDCRVEEGPIEGSRSQLFQDAVVRCLNEDSTLSDTLALALTPFLGEP